MYNKPTFYIRWKGGFGCEWKTKDNSLIVDFADIKAIG